ncbi:chromosome partitioning protein ParB [Corynebacterium suranareeae]|uniref:Chromosome partitioning protein ParB n=1 Tax=Corynebacterium suranareeae TaxID=2506452 RepID=A0A161JPY2_9CORY|nr:ParB/RepB/Spo0J family partition protein [Corynebacterium suranareeae]BAU97453.1 chromosome partitioning protein ParB [Corynebacterium suranareeae]
MAQNKGSDKSQTEKRKGGLGRGLAALIPSGPSNSPGLGGGAADIILGGTVGARNISTKTSVPPKPAAPERQAPKQEAKPAATEVDKSADKATTPEVTTPEVTKEPAQTTDFGASYQEIPVEQIRPNPQQPRHEFDPQALDELVHSITEFGLMQPIVVRRADEGFELIMGERRWRASKRAGLEVIPAIVRETEDGAMLRDALLENIHRVQLNPLEEAAAYQQLLEEFGVTQAELADKLGRSRPVITNMIRLLGLPVNVQTKVAAGVLSAGHARALLGLKAGEEAQDSLATRIIAEGLSVRATEELVLLHNRGDQPEEKKPREKAETPEVFTRAAESLADNLDTKVSVMMGKKKGKLVVEFGDKDDFERIMSLIQGR